MDKLTNKISDLSSVPVYANKFNELIEELEGTITPSYITTGGITSTGTITTTSINSNAITTSTIMEKTTGSGVTIDNVLLKDGTVSMATQILAATGSTQANAAAITGQMILVTGADNTKGVVLPALTDSDTNRVIFLINTASAALKIYPFDGQKIQGGTANANISLAGYCVAIFAYKATDDWYATEITAGAVA